MHVILLFALVTTNPQSPAERWVPYTANPAWEIFGTEDANGVFRYSNRRRKESTGPVVNFGVDLRGPAPSPGAPVVMGTDNETMRLLVPRASAGSATPKPCAHSDCPNGRCDRDRLKIKPKPKPDGLPEFKLPQLEFRPIYAAMVIGGLALACLGAVVVVVILFAVFLISRLFKGRAQP